MRKEEVAVYTFDELEPNVKEKVLDKNRNINVEDNDYWYEWLFDKFIEDMAKIGFIIEYDNINFRGFSSQGDGASFAGTLDELGIWKFLIAEKWMEDFNHFKRLTGEDGSLTANIKITVSRAMRYVHSKMMDVEWELESGYNSNLEITQEDEKWFNGFADRVLVFARKKVDELYDDLEEDYDNLISDEAVAETLLSNELEFHADGRQFFA